MIGPSDITGLVLAGGRGSRMGGVDKGLQTFRGQPLALNALQRLQAQAGGLVGPLMVNANRNLAAYQTFGHPVWPDSLPGFAGPLAGVLAGLEHSATPFLLTVPCDVPLFPLDLAQRLARAFDDPATQAATVSAPEGIGNRDGDGVLRPQPVFSLLRSTLLPDLRDFMAGGGRQVGQWLQRQHAVTVPFAATDHDAQAFCNANTLAELQSLQRH